MSKYRQTPPNYSSTCDNEMMKNILQDIHEGNLELLSSLDGNAAKTQQILDTLNAWLPLYEDYWKQIIINLNQQTNSIINLLNQILQKIS